MYKKTKIIMLSAGLFIFIFCLNFAVRAETLSLQESIDLALENNLELAVGEYDQKIAETGIRQAESALRPQLDFMTSYTRQKEREEPETGEITVPDEDLQQIIDGLEDFMDWEEIMPEAFASEIFYTEFNARYPLYTGGRLSTAVEMAETGLGMSEVQLEQKKISLAREVADSYYDILLAQALIDLNQDFLQQAEEFLELTQQQYEEGIVTESDILQAEAEKASVERSLTQAENRVRRAKRNFKYILGLPAHIDINLEDIELEEKKIPVERSRAVSLVKENNPNLQLLEAQKTLSGMEVEMKEAEKKPEIFASGTYNWQDTELSLDNGHWSLTLGLNYEIFDGGRRDAEIDRARLEEEQTAGRYEQVLEEIKQGLDILYLQFEEIKENLALMETQKKAAADNLELTEIRYEAGLVTALEITAAQTDVRQIKTEILQLEYEFLSTAARLAELLGYQYPGRFF